MKIKILIAADRSFTTENLISSIAEDDTFEMLEPVNTRKALVNTLQREPPQILLLDINMPAVDGIDALLTLKTKYRSVKTIVISEYDSPKLVSEIRKLGARGYFVKNIPFDNFKKIVLEIHQGLNWADYLRVTPGPASYYLSNEFAGYRLTKREVDVIRLLYRHYTCDEVSELMNLSAFSTKLIQANIYKKLALQNENQLINFAKENNIVE